LNTLSTLFLNISIKKFEVKGLKEKYFFEIFLAITLVVTMPMTPVSGQFLSTPTSVLPSVQDYLQITAATITTKLVAS
jgi:hypothetical protein